VRLLGMAGKGRFDDATLWLTGVMCICGETDRLHFEKFPAWSFIVNYFT